MDIIRTDTDYAMRALLYLALAGDRHIRCADVAECCGIPKSFAYKVLSHLSHAGLVASRSGRSGGFRLATSPKRISLRKVVEAMQGPLTVSRCVVEPESCPRQQSCVVSAEWRRLQNDITRFLNGTTLHDAVVAGEELRTG